MGRTKPSANTSAFKIAAEAAFQNPPSLHLARAALKLVSPSVPFASLLKLTKILYPSSEFPTWSSFCDENPAATLGQGVGPHLHEAPDEICALLYDELFFCAASDPPTDCTGIIHQSGRPVFEGDQKILYEAEDTLEAQKALIFRFAGCSQHDFYEESLVDNSRGQSIFYTLFNEDPDEVAAHFCITTDQAKKILYNSLREGSFRAFVAFLDALDPKCRNKSLVLRTYDELRDGKKLYAEAVEAIKDEPQKDALEDLFGWAPDVEGRYRALLKKGSEDEWCFISKRRRVSPP